MVDYKVKTEDEYNALRAEILTRFKLRDQFVLTIAIATAAILGWALSDGRAQSPFLFLAPLTIIIPGAFHYASQCRAVSKIGSYLHVFHERPNAPSWERRGKEFVRDIERRWERILRFFYTLHYFALGCISVTLFVIDATINPAVQPVSPKVILATVAICIVLLVLAELEILSGYSLHEYYTETWEKIRGEELKRLNNDAAN